MQKSKIIYNSLSAVFQVIVVGIVYIILYKYLLETIGIKLLGVWSLIIATTSIVLIANFGISTSIVKFVSTYHTRKDYQSLKKLIFTAAVFILVTYCLISLFIFVIAQKALPYFIEPDYIQIALEILPYSLLSLLINAFGGVISSSLDGIQKNYIRSYIITFSSVLLLGLSILLTPDFGLKGLIFAQIFQAVLILAMSFYYLNKHISGVFELKWNWSKPIFREIISYGLKLQVLSFMQMSFEPVTKALLSKFGGLAMVGYYEMASRLVSQFRSIIVNANQVVIPVIASAKETNTSYIKNLYYKSFAIILFLNTIITTVVILSAPIISKLWIGSFEPVFIFAVVINSLAVFINICSNPAYFSYMGEGKLNPLILSYFFITFLNVSLAFILGYFFGGYGVIVAWNLAFMLGSLLVVMQYHKSTGFKLGEIITRNDMRLLASCMLLAGTAIYLFYLYISATPVLAWQESDIMRFGLLLLLVETLLVAWFVLKNNNFILLLSEARKILMKKQ